VRLGVLDIGSNTVHLLVADVRPGGRPLATTSRRTVLRLMRYLDADGAIAEEGVIALERAAADAAEKAASENVDELLATATSAVREAANGPEVIERIEAALGQPLQVLGGETEARFTFLAVRRWFGWAAGQVLLFDIGGGSLELASGADELPDLAASLPLGAGRMTIAHLPEDPPGAAAVERLREHASDTLAPIAKKFRKLDPPDHVVGSSKAIRSLAKLVG
jgi:exopolyphosphatase/guanosine-5'-triphosphate,3'-diphosphate pyrophosphatase